MMHKDYSFIVAVIIGLVIAIFWVVIGSADTVKPTTESIKQTKDTVITPQPSGIDKTKIIGVVR